MTAGQLFDWWTLYNDEPFGDLRSDLRAWAAAAATWGTRDVRLVWPYIDPPMTADELLEEMAAIEAHITEAEARHGNRRENLD